MFHSSNKYQKFTHHIINIESRKPLVSHYRTFTLRFQQETLGIFAIRKKTCELRTMSNRYNLPVTSFFSHRLLCVFFATCVRISTERPDVCSMRTAGNCFSECCSQYSKHFRSRCALFRFLPFTIRISPKF